MDATASLAGLPAFLAYFGLALALLAAYCAIYVQLTPHPEFALIRQNNAAAALAFGGSLLGFCLPLHAAITHSVGLLDERYFMYTEDVDLCVSLRKRGRDILFVPYSEVVHLGGRSARRNPHTERLRRASQLAYYEKHHARWVPLLRFYLRLSGKSPTR